ncbi:FrnE protein [Microbacterium esteraromaticum]|uniref:FrnE protein n=1 Tax=Microbacterium esteraromaticum TaxID=57043 RepID=A0A1R4IXY6_9MICO|nr:DsbA family oxidoreductase [Microbacterium esteraromaticum]SJN24732.1 FrnE protein [Microbacterium esteraromaticum]
MSEPISIDIWSDIACPWCYIGKRNLEKGIAAVSADADAPQVSVTFHSYELSPDTPLDYEGNSGDYFIEHRGMPRPQLEQMQQQVVAAASAAGLEYDLDAQKHANTARAHELIHFAKAQNRQGEMKERLMSAYFSEGRGIGSIDDLTELAGEAGLDRDAARTAMASGQFRDDVAADKEQARAYGITGVPFFVINGQYGISGAQPPEAFENVLRDLWAKRNEETTAAAE